MTLFAWMLDRIEPLYNYVTDVIAALYDALPEDVALAVVFLLGAIYLLLFTALAWGVWT